MTTEAQKRDQKIISIINIVRETLEKRFKDEFVFDPIIVKPLSIDYYGEVGEYFDILIVFDGDQRKLDPKWTVGLVGRIRPALMEMGITEIPTYGFVEKSEWEEGFPD